MRDCISLPPAVAGWDSLKLINFLREHFGDDYGSVACEADCFTRITLRLPGGGTHD